MADLTLCVSLDERTFEALRSVDRERFVGIPDFDDAYRMCRQSAPVEVVVDCRSDPANAYRLLQRLWELGSRRPRTVAVGSDRQTPELQRHAQLRSRADDYVIAGSDPRELARAIARGSGGLGKPGSAGAGTASSVLLAAAAIVVGPSLAARGHVTSAAAVVAVLAAVGLVVEVGSWRRGAPRRTGVAGGFAAVMLLSIGLAVATVLESASGAWGAGR